MNTLARSALVVLAAFAALLAGPSRASAWTCDLYFDTTPFPRWEPVGTSCSLYVLSEHTNYDPTALGIEALVDGEWMPIAATATGGSLELTAFYSVCAGPDTCEPEGWEELVEYLLYTITPDEPLPEHTELRIVHRADSDTEDIPYEVARFETGDAQLECITAGDIPDPYCSGAPCDYEYPDECGDGLWDDDEDDLIGDDGDDDGGGDGDDDGWLGAGCNTAGGGGGGALLVLLALGLVAIRHRTA